MAKSGAKEIVKSLPMDMPVEEVLQKLEEQGFTVKPATVKVYRQQMRAAENPKPKAPKPESAATNGVVKKVPPAPPQATPERQFAELVLRIGTQRARDLLDKFEVRVQQFVS